MLLLFSVRVGEWSPVLGRVVHSMYCACLLSEIISLYVSFCDCISS